MIFQSEKQLLKIIKYTPSVFIILISLLLIAILFFENRATCKFKLQQAANFLV